MESPSVGVLIIAEQVVVRAGIRHLLQTATSGISVGISVVAEASDTSHALRLAQQHTPEVAIIGGVASTSASGSPLLTLIPLLRSHVPGVRVLVLRIDDAPMACAEDMGDDVYISLPKTTTETELYAAIKGINSRKDLVPHRSSDTTQGAGDAHLTPRERQILVRVSAGCTNKQIAGILGISLRTVETHRGNITRKLGIYSVAGLTRYAIEHGLAEEM